MNPQAGQRFNVGRCAPRRARCHEINRAENLSRQRWWQGGVGYKQGRGGCAVYAACGRVLPRSITCDSTARKSRPDPRHGQPQQPAQSVEHLDAIPGLVCCSDRQHAAAAAKAGWHSRQGQVRCLQGSQCACPGLPGWRAGGWRARAEPAWPARSPIRARSIWRAGDEPLPAAKVRADPAVGCHGGRAALCGPGDGEPRGRIAHMRAANPPTPPQPHATAGAHGGEQRAPCSSCAGDRCMPDASCQPAPQPGGTLLSLSTAEPPPQQPPHLAARGAGARPADGRRPHQERPGYPALCPADRQQAHPADPGGGRRAAALLLRTPAAAAAALLVSPCTPAPLHPCTP